jgi:hypothetical protein
MSFLKCVNAARARLRESATPCDIRDIATPDASLVAVSQVSQWLPHAESRVLVAQSQVSQGGPCSDGLGNQAECWRHCFEERAAIREHDGGIPRAEAEAGAMADCVARWRALNPLPASGNGTCIHCGMPQPDTPVLACGGHAWLHKGCWLAMDAARQCEAETAIRAALSGSDIA